ncbi:MAG: TatD family hydrolase [Snodgrassella sp.]|nr:TatD family hydrolase [Snodgrassella sp.]
MLFDSHCHLNHKPLIEKLPEILTQAAFNHINGFLVPATQAQDWELTIQLAANHPQIYAAIGIHPWFVSSSNNANFTKLEQLLHQNSQPLLGEIGLDFVRARDQNSREQQIQCFELQLQIANSIKRPIVVHHVHATSACLKSIKRCSFTHGGFAHAFSGSIEEAHEWIKYGFLIGIGSLLLHQQAKKVRIAAQTLPLQNIVIETDAPYMSPKTKQYNSPNNLIQIAKIIANLRNIQWEEVAEITAANALTLLGNIPKPLKY